MTVWSDEEVGRLTVLWGSGMPASKIADEFPGATRNSILGKAHRLKLTPRRHESASGGRPKIKHSTTVKVRIPPQRVKSPPVAPEGDFVPFMKAGTRTCRAVMGNDPEGRALFCSNEKDIEESFCPYHLDIFYEKKA